MLAAIVLGYEAAERIGEAIMPLQSPRPRLHWGNVRRDYGGSPPRGARRETGRARHRADGDLHRWALEGTRDLGHRQHYGRAGMDLAVIPGGERPRFHACIKPASSADGSDVSTYPNVPLSLTSRAARTSPPMA